MKDNYNFMTIEDLFNKVIKNNEHVNSGTDIIINLAKVKHLTDEDYNYKDGIVYSYLTDSNIKFKVYCLKNKNVAIFYFSDLKQYGYNGNVLFAIDEDNESQSNYNKFNTKCFIEIKI